MNTKSSNNSEYIDIKSIFKIAIRYWYIFIISGIICTGIGAVYFFTAKSLYKFAANIMIKENELSSMSSRSAAMLRSLPFGNFSSGNINVYDELQVISSFTTYREAVKELKLNITYIEKKFPQNIHLYNNSPIEIKSLTDIADTLKSDLLFNITLSKNKCNVKVYKSGLLKKKIGEINVDSPSGNVSTIFGDFKIMPTPYFDPEKKYRIKAKFSSYDLSAQLLQKNVEIDLASKKANLIGLATTEYNIEKGENILNTLINVYNVRGLEQKKDNANNTIIFLDGRLNIIHKELTDLEEAIEFYKKQHDIIDVQAEIKAIYANNAEFKKQQLEIETQHTVIEYVEDFIVDPQNKYALIPLNIGLSDQKIIQGLQQYNDALLTRMKLLKNTNDNNPAIEIANEQLDAMRINLANTIQGLKNGLEITRSKLAEQEKYYESRLKNMPTQEREFISLMREQRLKQELYMYLLQKREENCLILSETTPKAQVVDSAYKLYKPVSPRLLFVLISIVFLTCLISISYIVIKEYIRRNKKLNDRQENFNK